jgi:hypothetical protein
MQPLTQPTDCFSVTGDEGKDHGTHGQKLRQTIPQDQEGETTQLPPLRP